MKKTTIDEANYQAYLEERKLLIEALREGSRTFDKAILTVSSGAFGLTIAFMKEIAPEPFQNTLWLIATSWICFSISLIVILLSFLFSQIACREQIDIAYDSMLRNMERQTKWGKITTLCNYISIVTLIAAIVFWGFFAFWNIRFTN